MTRRLRPALELVSDIGELGFDLQHHSDEAIAEAVMILRTVNPQMFDWLVRVLSQEPLTSARTADAVDPSAAHTGTRSTRDEL